MCVKVFCPAQKAVVDANEVVRKHTAPHLTFVTDAARKGYAAAQGWLSQLTNSKAVRTARNPGSWPLDDLDTADVSKRGTISHFRQA